MKNEATTSTNFYILKQEMEKAEAGGGTVLYGTIIGT
jgi:hypothetical protein